MFNIKSRDYCKLQLVDVDVILKVMLYAHAKRNYFLRYWEHI